MSVFSCGTEAADWVFNNCECCIKYDPESAENTDCEFSNKVSLGFFGEGPTIEEFREYGYTDKPGFLCSKIDTIE